MIGRLRGVVAEIGEEEALIDVLGVGYAVRCGARTLSRMPALGEEATLMIETHWTQDGGPRLFGFLTREDRRAFSALNGVQGVGPKAALAVLDVLSPAQLAEAVAREDKTGVGRAQGVGPKLALRIVTELKGKPLVEVGAFTPPAAAASTPAAAPSVAGEAVSALIGLGIAEPLARRCVDQAQQKLGADAALPAVIRAALQETAR